MPFLRASRVWVETIDPNKVSAASALIVAVFTGFLAKLAYTQNRETRILQRAYLTVEPDGIDQFKVKQDAPIEDLVGRTSSEMSDTCLREKSVGVAK